VLARPEGDRRGGAVGERAHERRLADAGLPADEHEPAALLERRRERHEQVVALEHLAHASMSEVARPPGKRMPKIGIAAPQSG
jgi:hypothetical protein